MSILKRRRRDYHGVSPYVDPKRLKKQEGRRTLQRVLNRVYSVIIIGTLFWFMYLVFFGSFFKLGDIEFTKDDDEMIRKTVSEFLSEKRYKIFPQRNFFILDEAALADRLKQEFFLSELKITKDFPRKLKIEFKKRVSSINLCVAENCYLVDYLGAVKERVLKDELKEDVPLVYYRREKEELVIVPLNRGEGDSDNETESLAAESGELKKVELPRIIPGLTKLPEKKVRFLLALDEMFRREVEINQGIKIDSIEIDDFLGLEGKVTINTREGFKIFFDENENLEEQIYNLSLVLTNELKHKLETIEYIDVRFGSKIYYK